MTPETLECVVNVSEGRDLGLIEEMAGCTGSSLLDVHSDPFHNRSVLTLGGPEVEDAARSLARWVVGHLDLGSHRGVHPRIGTLDVVPFVPLGSDDLGEALAARDRFGSWAGEVLELPCFVYGPERELPELRREAFATLAPDYGPPTAHPRAGGCAVGARGVLVAYNLWLSSTDLALARSVASRMRSPAIRTLGLDVGGHAQISCNLTDPLRFGPADAYDTAAGLLAGSGTSIARAELVGLVPHAVLSTTPRSRWDELGIGEERTIEERLARR